MGPEIDDKTIKFYSDGGTEGSERADNNPQWFIWGWIQTRWGVFTSYSQVNLMDQLVVFQNTEFKNPIMLSTGNNTITVGLEGQVRYNIENEEVQLQKLNDGWTNVLLVSIAATDTILTAVQPNEVLTWNGSSWVNLPVNPLGSFSMDIFDAIDVKRTTGMFIRYDGTFWERKHSHLDMSQDFD